MNTIPQKQLKRELGVFAATLMGLGSIVGTGVFVSIGIAAGIAGSGVIIAVAIGAIIAICNGLNSAQLAASHPVSGGTYEYGYRYLNPAMGFTAGWMFLVAKTASAATAALGFAGYLIRITGWNPNLLIPIALIAAIAMTIIVLNGIRRSNIANTIIVSVTLLSLCFLIISCVPPAIKQGANNLIPLTASPGNILQASALMFVAYTGYGRIATLGEEARSPQKTIPQAMIICLFLVMLLYMAVAGFGIAAVGIDVFNNTNNSVNTAPLERVAQVVGGKGAALFVTIGAMTAMLGVLLNLILGLSRVLLAMGRRGDAPRFLARLNQQQTTPYYAVLLVGVGICLLILLGNVKTTWSFSAFSVLIYYALTNLAALKLPSSARLYPIWVTWLGLLSCLFLAFWVDSSVWVTGLGLIGVGLVWQQIRLRIYS